MLPILYYYVVENGMRTGRLFTIQYLRIPGVEISSSIYISDVLRTLIDGYISGVMSLAWVPCYLWVQCLHVLPMLSAHKPALPKTNKKQ
jgi:hypothetical protein